MYRHFFKRFFDFWISLIALICLSPFLLIVIIWLHFANKGAGVFFTQERPGKDARVFKVIKFKTMTDEGMDEKSAKKAAQKKAIEDARYVLPNSCETKIMLTMNARSLYNFFKLRACNRAQWEIRDGITGWAQCHGRNAISWTERFKLDVWYVDHCSIWTDIKVIFITIKKVLCRADISSATSATMEPFNGNN